MQNLKLGDLITKQEHSSLKPSVPKTPKARSILNIDKDTLKIRLIINTQNSPIYKKAKKIFKELRPLIKRGKSCIKDKEQSVDKSRITKLEENETKISFDISDMYPSLPKQDVITEVARRINDENFKPLMNKKALIELVNISVGFIHFLVTINIMSKKMDYSLAHQHSQHLQNYIYKELKKFIFTE